MKNVIIVVAAVAGLVAASGCAQAGMFTAANLTTVELSEPNYTVVATGVSGQARASYAIGVSFSKGSESGSLSLFRLGGTGHLYKEAMEDLWNSFEAQHGPAEGRRLALVNVRYDSDATNLLLYSDLTLAIRADVVEFTD